MPLLRKSVPAQTQAAATPAGDRTNLRWTPPAGVSKIAIQTRHGATWRTAAIVPASAGSVSLPRADAFAVTSLDRYGNSSAPKILGSR